MIVLEEAHNLLLKKATDSTESVLETSIRMVRQYGLGYVFVDQSASLLSKVAFANSYATIALSQKLRSDVQIIAGAMNLTDEQKQALNTLPVGTAVVRLADEYPEPFVVKIRRCPIREGCISDKTIRAKWGRYYSDSTLNSSIQSSKGAVPAISAPDNKEKDKRNNLNMNEHTHPPSPRESQDREDKSTQSSDSKPEPPNQRLNREEIRFLADVATRPLSTTVSRYQRLNLSRRRGNAIRQHLAAAGIIKAVTIATRSGQVVLYELTDLGRTVCSSAHIEIGPRPRESLEHRYWVAQTAKYFEKQGYDVTREHPVKGNGAIDILAQRHGTRAAVEVETGKSSITANLAKTKDAGFDKIVFVATSAMAVSTCQKAIEAIEPGKSATVELLTWLDVS
jgi:hypothetical protein